MANSELFSEDYLKDLKIAIDGIDFYSLNRIINAIQKIYQNSGQLFIIGNGGSASTASHLATDLSKGTLGHKGDLDTKRFNAISLCDNIALISAWANDTSYDMVFAEQLKNMATPSDGLVAISASGNSPNILHALKAAKEKKVITLGLAGFGGGKMAKLCDHCLVIDSNHYGRVEDIHMIVAHIISYYFAEFLRKSDS